MSSPEVTACTVQANLPPKNRCTEKMAVSLRHLVASLLCPLCNKLYTNPTTFLACRHTFCADCVTQHLSKHWSCYVCNIPGGERKINPQLCSTVSCFAEIIKVLNHSEDFWWRDKSRSSKHNSNISKDKEEDDPVRNSQDQNVEEEIIDLNINANKNNSNEDINGSVGDNGTWQSDFLQLSPIHSLPVKKAEPPVLNLDSKNDIANYKTTPHSKKRALDDDMEWPTDEKTPRVRTSAFIGHSVSDKSIAVESSASLRNDKIAINILGSDVLEQAFQQQHHNREGPLFRRQPSVSSTSSRAVSSEPDSQATVDYRHTFASCESSVE